ncbi:DinB family protein [Brevibacillus humidisoli]|uniref:DinB family protein n=1 Tax=Brevibacillus humidisoli TaxID=2895522 RepID=UPI001E29E585|nr:DinB family protein [Brevibacillus humidisoli]UFJ42591.1 DinB family protein [Brevibacillus humidisoli]
MSAVNEMKQMLFEELALIVRTSANLIRKVKPEEWNYRPVKEMRTLQELTEHLVAIPTVDLLILQEGSQVQVRQLESQFSAVDEAEQWIAAMERGVGELRAYMDSLSHDEFLHKMTTPFYLDHGTAQAKWLIEIVTHMQHHRAQLFTYMKQLGHEINMFDLYT